MKNENPDDKSTGWKKKFTKDFKNDGYTCEVWQKKNQEGGVDWIQFKATMKDVDPTKIIEYYRNPPLEKMKMIKEMYVIE